MYYIEMQVTFTVTITCRIRARRRRGPQHRRHRDPRLRRRLRPALLPLALSGPSGSVFIEEPSTPVAPLEKRLIRFGSLRILAWRIALDAVHALHLAPLATTLMVFTFLKAAIMIEPATLAAYGLGAVVYMLFAARRAGLIGS